MLLLFAGQLACEAVNFILKRLIKEERPPRRISVDGDGLVTKGYGMPSSHAQFVVFWAVAVGLFLMVRHRPPRLVVARRGEGKGQGKEVVETKQQDGGKQKEHPSLLHIPHAYRTGGLSAATASIEAYSHSPWTLLERALLSFAALVLAALVAWSRVYLGYHTVRQVLAGCAAGAGCAAAWFAVTYALRETGALAWALEMPVARWFRVRDLVVVEDVCQAGWEKWERRRARAAEEAAASVKGKGKEKGEKGE